MNSSFDAVTIGNSTIDIFFPISNNNDHFRFNEETKELCMHLGDKTIVDHVKLTLGGNASNVGVGLSKLGFNIAVFSEIGKDEFAEKILNELKKEKVNCSYIKQAEGTLSSVSIILTYKKERTIITEDTEREHEFRFSDLDTKWVYLTSLNKKWEETYQKTLEFVKDKKVKLAFNPGTRQLDAGREKIKDILKETEVLIVNKEEAGQLLSKEKGEVKELLEGLKALGAKVAVITDGTNGSYALDKDNKYFENSNVNTDSIERTGAGDAYSSGFLSAYMLCLGVEKAMHWGTLNASATVEKIGATVGLLTREEIEKTN